jgi:hypothetical protein
MAGWLAGWLQPDTRQELRPRTPTHTTRTHLLLGEQRVDVVRAGGRLVLLLVSCLAAAEARHVGCA